MGQDSLDTQYVFDITVCPQSYNSHVFPYVHLSNAMLTQGWLILSVYNNNVYVYMYSIYIYI